MFDTKEEALDALEAARAEYLEEARWQAFRLGVDGTPVTVDDVREVCPPPEGIDPRVMGGIFRPTEWEPCGYVNSKRRACHKRVVRQFRRKR